MIDPRELKEGESTVLARVLSNKGLPPMIQLIDELEPTELEGYYRLKQTEAAPVETVSESEPVFTGRNSPGEMYQYRYNELLKGYEHWELDQTKRAVERDRAPTVYELADSDLLEMYQETRQEELELYDDKFMGFYKPAKNKEFDFIETDKVAGVLATRLNRMLRLEIR